MPRRRRVPLALEVKLARRTTRHNARVPPIGAISLRPAMRERECTRVSVSQLRQLARVAQLVGGSVAIQLRGGLRRPRARLAVACAV